jgi:hypothetical protein
MNATKPLKVLMIERSLSCFVWGLLGLIPVLGIPMAIHSMHQHWCVKRDSKDFWNPAGRYLLWGVVCARVGGVISVLIVGTIVILVSFKAMGNESLNTHSLFRIF